MSCLGATQSGWLRGYGQSARFKILNINHSQGKWIEELKPVKLQMLTYPVMSICVSIFTHLDYCKTKTVTGDFPNSPVNKY